MKNHLITLLILTFSLTSFAQERLDIRVLPEDMEQIKDLNCGNAGPSLRWVDDNYRDNWFRLMKVPYVRLHDIPYTNVPFKIVDMHMIFSNWNLSAGRRNAYWFEETDDYLHMLDTLGTKMYYRLGVSIENIKKGRHYHIHPPKNHRKWANVASNIIRHYTEGKWDGYHYDIEYWEIWNEPDLDQCWTGTQEEFYDFYIDVSKILKKRFPHLKIGGPAFTTSARKTTRPFMKACAEAGAPIDFFTFHNYPKLYQSTSKIVDRAERIRPILDSLGYDKTEIHLNEWHPINSWDINECNRLDADGAAFITSVMLGFQDSSIDKAFFYNTENALSSNGCASWGVACENQLTDAFYAMCAVGELREHGTRLALEGSGFPEDTRALAARDKDGNVCVLIAGYKTGPCSVKVDLSALGTFSHADIHLLDQERKLDKTQTVTDTTRPFEINTGTSSLVVLIRARK